MRDLLAVLPRWATSTLILFGGLFAIAYVGPALERRGLPGIAVAGAILLLLVVLSARVVLRGFPPRGRRRMLAGLATERGLRLRIRPRLPRSMGRLPSLSDPRFHDRDSWHLISVPGDPPILAFDRRVSSEDAYEPPTWFASVACTIPLDAPSVIVEPRPAVTADPLGPLIVWSSESEGFARRSRIRTRDRLFATTLLDQRMLAWLLEQDPAWRFEVGGRWAMVSRPADADPRGLDEAVKLLRAFRTRIPGAARSRYPSEPDRI